MTSIYRRTCLLLICHLALICPLTANDPDSTAVWNICIRSEDNAIIPKATIASYSKITSFVVNEEGCIKLSLPVEDSIRVVSMGFEAKTVVLNQADTYHTGNIIVKLSHNFYQLKEVNIYGYQGILDPMIFPKFEDDSPKIDLHLPSNFGSQISKLPPNERPDVGNMGVMGAIFSPASFIYSKFSKTENSKLSLQEARAEQKHYQFRDQIAGPDIIAMISGFEGKELNDFIVYCNKNLKISNADNIIMAINKIELLAKKYKEEKGIQKN